jgi:hypothetical protein
MPSLVTCGLDKIFFRELIAGVARFTIRSASTFQWRFAQENCNDFFSALLQARDDKTGEGFSTEQLVSEAGILTVAGTDTTGSKFPDSKCVTLVRHGESWPMRSALRQLWLSFYWLCTPTSRSPLRRRYSSICCTNSLVRPALYKKFAARLVVLRTYVSGRS